MNNLKKIIFFFCFFVISAMNSITVDNLKKSEDYLWGKGKARTLQKADKKAIHDLLSQISIQVESNFTDILIEENGNVSEYSKSILNTYSNTTLHQAKRIVIEKRGKTTVYRYIRKENINRIFENRRNKIFEYVKSAISAENDLRIADALKYYYWSLALLRSHPNHNEIKYQFSQKDSVLLISELPKQIDEIFSGLDFSIINQIEDKEEKSKTIQLLITYNNIKVSNLDYHYWTGDTWTNIVSSKDGLGIIDFFGVACNSLKTIKLKCEYIYENKSKVDLELRKVIEDTELPFFSNADFEIPFSKITNSNFHDSKSSSENKCEVKVLDLITAISDKNYHQYKNYFTNEGYLIFDKLIHYGKAEIIPRNPNLNSFIVNGNTYVRSVPMRFTFSRNDRVFIENVVFSFNRNKQINDITFSLSKKAEQDILNKGNRFGTIEEKYLLIHFLETYKTAYCLNRIDYLESIFDENALIIIGNVLDKKEQIEGLYKTLGEDVNLIKLNKKEYIQRLKRVFNNNEFVNIFFEENSVKKVNGDDKTYGIEIFQNYYSENYADKGYLFLMIDLNDIQKPKIYVRTWQPERNKDGSIWGLSDFE